MEKTGSDALQKALCASCVKTRPNHCGTLSIHTLIATQRIVIPGYGLQIILCRHLDFLSLRLLAPNPHLLHPLPRFRPSEIGRESDKKRTRSFPHLVRQDLLQHLFRPRSRLNRQTPYRGRQQRGTLDHVAKYTPYAGMADLVGENIGLVLRRYWVTCQF
jgi:hypothetical protein